MGTRLIKPYKAVSRYIHKLAAGEGIHVTIMITAIIAKASILHHPRCADIKVEHLAIAAIVLLCA